MAILHAGPDGEPMRPYHYEALAKNTIRLIHLAPGDEGSEIFCSITHVRLAEKLTNGLADKLGYEALSYTWGDPTKTHAIYCGKDYVAVTKNLYSILHQLRQPDEKRTLWVDAICIWQENVAEKTEQVQRMRHIYLYADQVLVWLGNEYPTDSKVFGLFEEFSESDGRQLPQTALVSNQLWKDGAALSHAVAHLFQRPYFRRVWIIQEIAFAKKAQVICGAHSTQWETLARFVSFLQQNGMEILANTSVYTIDAIVMIDSIRKSFTVQLEQLQTIANFSAIAEKTGWGTLPGTSASDITSIAMIPTIQAALAAQVKQSPKLVELLEKTQIFSATDARDAVTALAGLASDITPTASVLDYSVPASTIYHRLAIHRLVLQQDLSYLSFAGIQPRTAVPGLPTWVPDWSVNANESPRSSLSGLGFHASGISRPTITLSANSNELSRELKVPGYVVETISRVGKHRISIEMPNPYFLDMTSINEEMSAEKLGFEECDDIARFAEKPTYPTGDPLAAVFWRLWVCNRFVDGTVPPPVCAEIETGTRYLIDKLDDVINKRFDKIDPAMYTFLLNPLAQKYYASVAKWTSGRRFCATEGRYLGWVPKTTQAGDLIAVLQGGAVPMVLRRRSTGQYDVLGDCYIHGIMDGEAWQKDGVDLEMFCFV